MNTENQLLQKKSSASLRNTYGVASLLSIVVCLIISRKPNLAHLLLYPLGFIYLLRAIHLHYVSTRRTREVAPETNTTAERTKLKEFLSNRNWYTAVSVITLAITIWLLVMMINAEGFGALGLMIFSVISAAITFVIFLISRSAQAKNNHDAKSSKKYKTAIIAEHVIIIIITAVLLGLSVIFLA
jgi:uncharacterized membrane protein